LQFLFGFWHNACSGIEMKSTRNVPTFLELCWRAGTGMAEEEKNNSNEGKFFDSPAAPDDLFRGDVREQLSEEDVFAGPVCVSPASASFGRLSVLQKVLLVCITVLGVVVGYSLVGPILSGRSWPMRSTAGGRESVGVDVNEGRAVSEASGSVGQAGERSCEGRQEVVLTGPVSLSVADRFYMQADYRRGYAAYKKLAGQVKAGGASESMKDFLYLRMGFCRLRAGDLEQAKILLRQAAHSRSAVVAAVASYSLSVTELEKQQYLQARRRAYQALALLDAVQVEKDWAYRLRGDCHFVLGRAVMGYVLSLYVTAWDLPEEFVGTGAIRLDPFVGLSDERLEALVDSGREKLQEGILRARIRQVGQGQARRWSVCCREGPVEELLVRFAANAGLDIQWHLAEDAGRQVVRDRAVSVYMPSVTARQFVRTGAGCAGLVAKVDDAGVEVYDPSEYSSLSAHIERLCGEAVSLWREFLWGFEGDERIACAHFALGVLESQTGRISEALAEFKLVSQRFPRSSSAPFALLHSSRLKMRLRNYRAACGDLEHLVERYPDNEVANRASLELGVVTEAAGLYGQAERRYQKVYHLDWSSESRQKAALGAGRCLYALGKYEDTVKWLNRYIEPAAERGGKDLPSAYLLLGKAYLGAGQSERACEALRHALEGGLSRQQYAEVVSVLVDSLCDQGDFGEALSVLEAVETGRLSPEQRVGLLVVKSRVMRSIGLFEEAVALLRGRMEYTFNSQLKGEIGLELARCYQALGDMDAARMKLGDALSEVEPGPLSEEIELELAEVCLEVGEDSEAITICLQLLDTGPSETTNRRALQVLAGAYGGLGDYERAVMALLGRWTKSQANEKGLAGEVVVSGR